MGRLSASAHRAARRPWLPLAALAGIVVLDLVGRLGSWPIPLEGPRDESAHLLTAWLFLAAVVPVGRGRFRAWVLAGAVLLDLDHIPLFLWGVGSAASNGRPVTHSLVTVLLLLAVAAVARRLRVPLLGLALGVVLHLLRDAGEGPGIPLLWPLSPTSLQLPYAVYLAVVAALAGVAVRGRVARRRRMAVSAATAPPEPPRSSAPAHQVCEQ